MYNYPTPTQSDGVVIYTLFTRNTTALETIICVQVNETVCVDMRAV